MHLELIPPKKSDSCYRFRVNVDGYILNSYLTYELHPSQPEERTILLVKYSPRLVSPEYRGRYQAFAEFVQRQSAEGKLLGAKRIVNRLVSGELDFPQVRVAVQRLGPVPVFVLPETYKLPLHEEPVQIGIYPSIRRSGRQRHLRNTPHFVSARIEFIESLTIGLDRIFKRYLEDVAESMHDIENHLSLPGVFARAKEIERVIGESVKAKLSCILPAPGNWARYERGDREGIGHVVQCTLFDNATDIVLIAAYARQYTLYFVNELYRHIGLESRSEYYLDGFAKVEEQFGVLKGMDWFKESVSSRLSQVSDLYSTLKAYHYEDYGGLKRIDPDSGWTEKFVAFAKFLVALNRLELTASEGRVFLSYLHDVPKAEILKSQIEDYVCKELDRKVHVLSYQYGLGEWGSSRIRDEIKHRIWSADIVKGIIPKDTSAVETVSRQKNYLWIAIEAEHGLLLDKRLFYLVEDGTDIDAVLADFSREDLTFLAPNANLSHQERLKRLVNSFEYHTFVKWNVSGDNRTGKALDPRVREHVKAVVQEAIYARHEAIVIGYMSQFSGQVRATLCQMHRISPNPVQRKSRRWFATKLAEKYHRVYRDEAHANRAFQNCWRNVKKRALEIDGAQYTLVELHSRRYYSCCLQRILGALESSADKNEIAVRVRKILGRVESQLG